MTRRKKPSVEYPIGQRMPAHLKSKTGLRYQDIGLESLRLGDVNTDDLSIDADALRMQAHVAARAGYVQLASNLRRASELVNIPNDRLLEIYEALRPRHSTYLELWKIGDELLRKYKAPENARFVRDAADAYRDAGLLLSMKRSRSTRRS
jgi:propanediol dehydratase small subunit